MKRRLSTTFHLKTNSQIKRQNSTMEAYLGIFINYKQDNWTRFLPVAKFAYNNAKCASTGYPSFMLNYRYHSRISYKEDVDPRSKSKTADELTKKLRNLMTAYRKNLQYAQELQKRAYNKGAKPKSYDLGEKVWLNSKYIKTKYNRKLDAKFFGSFRVLHPIDNHAYRLELPKR